MESVGASELLRLNGWARKVTGHGVVFYVRRGTNETRWVHPGLSQCVQNLSKYDNIRYAAYRLSSKLIEIQSILGSTSVSLALAQSVMSHHGLVSPTMILDWMELRQFLADLWHRSTRARGVFTMYPEQHEVYTEAVASLVEQILDPGHVGGVTVLGLKTILAVLTSARLRDRLAYLFREHSDHQARLSEPGLTYLMTVLSRIPEILGEGVMFGGGVVGRGVFSCLQAGGGRVVTEEVWMSWASREPPELVWLTTSYRQFASRQVQHPVRCSACHTIPIMGMRYQCLQCLSYDLCQNCFFFGVSTKGHKPKHPVQEYCYPSTKKEEAKAFIATLANKLKSRQNQPKPRKKITRALTADKISSGTSSSASSRPTSLQSSKSAHSKLSQLFIKVSPRSSVGESKTPQSPRSSMGDAVKTPLSPRCSIGDRIDKLSPVSSGFCSAEEGDVSPSQNVHSSPIYEPVPEDQPLEVDSPGLEWDDGGCELGHSATMADVTEDKEILEQIQNFENSIFRKDLDTGELRCYQHNTRRTARRDQMTSILGHLEDDHKKLQARLETGDDGAELVKPVLDAQSQLNRLKDLMQSMFRSQYFINETTRPETSDISPLLAENLGTEEILDKNQTHLKPEDIDHEYTYAHVNKNHGNFNDMTENNNDIKPTESTRLEIIRNIQTPKHKMEAFNLDFFSPITSAIKNQMEEDSIEDQKDNPTVTFNCLTADPEADHEASLTKYNLSDLSQRLGGTHLYISRDNGLDITDQLDDKQTNEADDVADTSKYAETMEELEQLMEKLSDVFHTFREPPNVIKKDDDSLFGLVNGINEDIYGFLSKSKESCI